MKINDAMRTYRLPNPTTPEDLESRWSKVLNFGDKVLLAGYFYNGKGEPSYFGAVYEHLDDDLSCEGTTALPRSFSTLSRASGTTRSEPIGMIRKT